MGTEQKIWGTGNGALASEPRDNPALAQGNGAVGTQHKIWGTGNGAVGTERKISAMGLWVVGKGHGGRVKGI